MPSTSIGYSGQRESEAWQHFGKGTREAGPIDSSVNDFFTEKRYESDVCLRGALLLDQLRSNIGDESFFAFLRDYYESQTSGLGAAESFFAVLSRHTTEELSPLAALDSSK
jgi:aminopeptidase N